jgi:beta-phosphoglucomutase-like phosphatase (HAD superfamily)
MKVLGMPAALMPVRAHAAVIFDVDGVLVASPHERAWREALDALMAGPWRHVAESIRYRYGALTPDLYQTQVAGKPRRFGAIAALAAVGVPKPEARADEYATAKQAQLEALIEAGEFVAYPDALDLVLDLLARGVPMAAASSSRNADAFMSRVDLAAHARAAGRGEAQLGQRRTLLEVFAANVCGRDVGRGKPEPDLFLMASSALRRPRQACVVVEDAPAGIEAAKAAGMQSLGVARRHDERLLADAGADVVVSYVALDAIAPLLARAEAAASTPA